MKRCCTSDPWVDAPWDLQQGSCEVAAGAAWQVQGLEWRWKNTGPKLGIRGTVNVLDMVKFKHDFGRLPSDGLDHLSE